MPALDLLVFVLEALVPVLQTLPFSLDAQLTSPWRQRHVAVAYMFLWPLTLYP